jgi:hypothetical protein
MSLFNFRWRFFFVCLLCLVSFVKEMLVSVAFNLFHGDESRGCGLVWYLCGRYFARIITVDSKIWGLWLAPSYCAAKVEEEIKWHRMHALSLWGPCITLVLKSLDQQRTVRSFVDMQVTAPLGYAAGWPKNTHRAADMLRVRFCGFSWAAQLVAGLTQAACMPPTFWHWKGGKKKEKSCLYLHQ